MNRKRAIVAEIPRLRRYARALVGNSTDADDLVQDCLLRALLHEEQWREGDNPRKWLFAILHNLYVDHARLTARRPRHIAIEAVEEVPYVHDPDESLAVLDIEAALQLLPAEQRQAVLLVALEGMSYAEIAEVLDVPVGTVMSRIARGREKLRQTFGRERGRRPPLKRVK